MSQRKTAFITGAAMGMGALQARKLAERNWQVFTGILPGSDIRELGTHKNITIVDQDVTDLASVSESAKRVSGILDEKGLDLLINNAGIANRGQGVIEGANIEDARLTFEVNMFGTWRVLQAFLPLIRKNAPHSRIINFASGAVKANPAASGAYNMSKHAVVGLTRTLRNELAPFGIQVTAVEPGAVKTHMTANSGITTQDLWTKIPNSIADIYAPYLKETTTTLMHDMLENKANEPETVVDQVLGLLEKKRWKPSYLVGNDVKALGVLYKLLPERAFEKMLQSAVKIPRYKG